MTAAIASLAQDAKSMEKKVMMLVTTEATSEAALRQAVMKACGEWVEFLRIQPVLQSTRIRVWLGVSESAVTMVMVSILGILPEGEIGRIAPI
jgi:hypothetical protein